MSVGGLGICFDFAEMMLWFDENFLYNMTGQDIALQNKILETFRLFHVKSVMRAIDPLVSLNVVTWHIILAFRKKSGPLKKMDGETKNANCSFVICNPPEKMASIFELKL